MGKETIIPDITQLSDNISEVIQKSSSAGAVGTYLQSLLQTNGLSVQQKTFFYSRYGVVVVGSVALLLAIVFFFAVIQRKKKLLITISFLIPLLLFCEMSLKIPVVSWPVLKKGKNLTVEFPVQNASQNLILATDYWRHERKPVVSNKQRTFSAFVFPAALVFLAMGIWQLAEYFGKFDSEDARTIMLVMAGFCIAYFAGWTAMSWAGLLVTKEEGSPAKNAGSIAILSTLASEMRQKHPRLENTSVTIAFLGGDCGQGADKLIDTLAHRRENSVETQLVEFREVGRHGEPGILVPWNAQEDLFLERRLVKAFSAAAAGIGHEPKVVLIDAPPSEEFPSLILTSIEPDTRMNSGETREKGEVNLLSMLRMIEEALLQIDSAQAYHPLIQQ